MERGNSKADGRPSDAGSDSVFIPRLVLCLLFGSMIATPTLYQPALDKIYSFLCQTAVYKASTFETFWTVLIYAIVEVSYTYIYGHNPQLRLAVQRDQVVDKPLPKMKRPKHRLTEGITYVAPLLLMDLTMIKKFAGVPLPEIRLSGNHEPDAKDVNGNFLTPTLHRFTYESPLQTQRALPSEAPTSRQLILQLACSLLLYDAVFFWFHLSLHKVSLLRKIHVLHHSHSEIHPQVTNRLDVVERLGLVLLANFSLNIIGSHVLTRTLFVPVFIWLLVDIHSGLDLERGYDKLLPRGWGAGSKRHSQHHQFGTKYFEPFFCWWDDALAFATI